MAGGTLLDTRQIARRLKVEVDQGRYLHVHPPEDILLQKLRWYRDSKYVYNFWRPQPAIAAGAIDGNDATTGDPTWIPLLPTPPHPEYVSGHSSNSSAIGNTLRLLFDDDPGAPLTVTLTGITREWETFSEAIDEVVDARVYSGIHFRTADEVGARLGRQVARFVFTHALKPARGRR